VREAAGGTANPDEESAVKPAKTSAADQSAWRVSRVDFIR